MASPGIDPDPDGAFSLCFQFSPFDDGGSVDVVSKCDVVDKPAQMSSNSAVIEAEVAASNVGHDNAIEQGDCSNLVVVSHPIDWESLLITPLTEEQIGTAHPVMDEDLVYEFVGLRAEDERAEQTRMAAQNVTQLNLDDMELQDAHLAVHDHVPGEDSFVYDQDDPPMEVGTIYASMDEFRDAVRQHAIKGQFQLVTKKSRKDYFHGRCSHEACSWNISARLIKCDGQQVRITVNDGKHELYARRRRIGEKFEGHVMLPLVVRQLYAMTRQLGNLKIEKGGRDEAQVSEVTASQKIIRHVVNIKDHVCTCREWQVSGKPCAHALALIITYRNAKMGDYLDPYYSVYHFRQTYGGVIKPLPDKSQWLRVHGFKVMPPLDKRNVGRVRKKRIPSCLENKGNKPRGKGMWQVKCPNCGELGHRSNSPKCPRNGTKKRKSRAKTGKAGRPAGSTKGKCDATPSPSKRQKLVVAESTSEINNSPGPVTRRQSQLQLTMGGLGGTSETGEGPSNTMTTPRKSPRKMLAHKKKLTPRKGKNMNA